VDLDLNVPLWAWVALGAVIVVMLAIDLLAHRGAHVIEFKEAAIWSAVWVAIALAFGGILFWAYGAEAGTAYTTAWLLEKSLSVDNLFVFALIFGYFKVPREYQHRVLFFGVFGALVFRGIFLGAGVAVVERFTAVLFLFGAILLWSAWKMVKGDDADVDPGRNIGVRMLKRVIPLKDEYHGQKFFIKEAGKRFGTPLLAVVAAIEAADLIFAVDSVPAVLAVSDEAFIVYSSNAFAILGLRRLSTIASVSETTMTPRLTQVGMCGMAGLMTSCPAWKNSFTPMKARMKASALLSRWKRSSRPESRKNSARSPRMAKALEEKTMNGSLETASTAGTLSTAKIRSAASMAATTASSGVP
jgi:tellurite resistance protein TerC